MVALGSHHRLQRISSTKSINNELKPREQRTIRRVKFEDTMKVYRIRSRRNLTKAEFRNCYMNASDFRRIRKEIKELLLRGKGGDLTAEDWDHLRGLEAYFDPATTMRNNAKKKYIVRSILSYQESENKDSEIISKMYQRLSKSAVHLAHKRGLMDQQQEAFSAPRLEVMVR